MTSTTSGHTALTLPFDPLTPLDPNSRPTVEAIRRLRKELYENAASVESSYGGGEFGLLGMLMPSADYNTGAPGTPFIMPDTKPPIPNLSGPGAEERKQQYELDVADYNRALQFQSQIKKMMLVAIPRLYIEDLSDKVMQFTMVTPKEILTHLMTTYGKIRDQDLDQNLENITRPWDPDTNIKLVFSNGKLC